MPYLSVVIPCYNEEKNLKKNIPEKVDNFLKTQHYESEVIIVDDGSTDKSISIIENFLKTHTNFFLIKNPHQGKAYTVITGMLAARGKYVLFSDLDQATPIEETKKILPFLEKGHDVVIGSRNSQRKGAPLLRLLMARGFMLLRRLLLGLEGISDTQCGFKGFSRDATQKIFKRLKLYGRKRQEVKGSLVTAGFDVEVLFLAKKLGMKIKEVPVEWHYVETRRVNPLTESWLGFLDMIKLRLNEAKGLYDEK